MVFAVALAAGFFAEAGFAAVFVAGFLAGAFVAAGFAAGAFLAASSFTPASFATFASALLRRAAVFLLSTFFFTAVSISLCAAASVLAVGLA